MFAAHFVRGVCGFGSALVSVPVLAWLWGPTEAVFVVVSLDAAGGFVLLPRVLRYVRWPLVAAMLVGTTGGQWVGTELLTTLPEAIVAGILGGAVAVFGLDILLRPVKPGRGELTDLPSRRGKILGLGVAAGAVGGVMSGLVGAGGPPIVVFMKRYFAPVFFRTNIIALFVVAACILVCMLLAKAAAPPSLLGTSAILVAPMVAGSLLGTRVSGRLSPVVFGRAVGAVLIGSGAALVVRTLL